MRRKGGLKPNHREGSSDGTWILLDYGCMVVHVFQEETRDYYRLEELWNGASVIDLSQEEGFEEMVYSERISAFLEAAKNQNNK